jgi:hypothetical protein
LRDLNNLYSEFLIDHTLRERLEQTEYRSRVNEALSTRTPAWQVMLAAFRFPLPRRRTIVSDPVSLPEPERGAAS